MKKFEQNGFTADGPSKGRGNHSPVPGGAIPVLTPDRMRKRQNGRRFKENGEDMFTLTTQDRHGVMVREKRECDVPGIDDMRIRRLTPRACFRLQGWEDKYFDRASMVNSDSQLYKQAGNQVTVNRHY